MREFRARTFIDSLRSAVGETPRQDGVWTKARALWRARESEFIMHIYPVLLGRAPDPTGLEAYSPNAATLAGKVRIICSLLLSRERARKSGLRLKARQCLDRLRNKFDCGRFMDSVRKQAGRGPGRGIWLKSTLELLKLQGPEFIQGAYMLILGRSADRRGVAAYEPYAHTRLGQMRIILSLLHSAEKRGKSAAR